MIYALYGALGAALVLLLLAAGVFIGYKLKARQVKAEAARHRPETPAEAERRRLIEDQAAFRQTMSYSVDMAYGMVPAKDFEIEGGET